MMRWLAALVAATNLTYYVEANGDWLNLGAGIFLGLLVLAPGEES